MLVEYLYFFFLILGYISFLINFRKFRTNKSILFFIAYNVVCATEIFAYLQYEYFGSSNFLTYYIGVDVIYAQIFLFFYYFLVKNKKFVLFSILAHALFNLSYLFYTMTKATDYKDLNYEVFYNYDICYFFNLIISLIVIFKYIFETFNSNIVLNIKQFFPFWITISLLINIIGHLPLYISLEQFKNDLSLFNVINNSVNIVSIIILIIGIFMNQDIDNSKQNLLNT